MNKENTIKCKRCGEIIEFKPGVPVNIMFLDKDNLEEPRYKYCYNCRKKWSEKNLRCKSCNTKISMHEYLGHNKLCDNCN